MTESTPLPNGVPVAVPLIAGRRYSVQARDAHSVYLRTGAPSPVPDTANPAWFHLTGDQSSRIATVKVPTGEILWAVSFDLSGADNPGLLVFDECD